MGGVGAGRRRVLSLHVLNPSPEDTEIDYEAIKDTAIPQSSPDIQLGSTEFVVDGRTDGEPSSAELSNENMLRVILGHATDQQVNTLVWKCLGYRRAEDADEWTADECFPKWRERFPTPPDLVGVTREYGKDIDQPVMKANQALVRTVPMEHKQSIKVHLRPLGFNGFKVREMERGWRVHRGVGLPPPLACFPLRPKGGACPQRCSPPTPTSFFP